MKKLLLLLLGIFFIIGCDFRIEMRERFVNGSIIMVDQNGKYYIVEHSLGCKYNLIPIHTSTQL